MAYFYNGRLIREGRSWIDSNGVRHPSNWSSWSTEEKTEKGLVWKAEPEPYDNRFWWDANTPKALDDVLEVDVDGQPILDEKGNQLVTLGLKSVWKTIIKQQAGSLLQDTDWYVTRNSETGEAIPAEVTTYRTAVRTKSGEIEAAINAATTHAEFVALFNVTRDSDLAPVSNAPISDWPEK